MEKDKTEGLPPCTNCGNTNDICRAFDQRVCAPCWNKGHRAPDPTPDQVHLRDVISEVCHGSNASPEFIEAAQRFFAEVDTYNRVPILQPLPTCGHCQAEHTADNPVVTYPDGDTSCERCIAGDFAERAKRLGELAEKAQGEALEHKARARSACQVLIEEIGSVGPESVGPAAERAVAVIKGLKAKAAEYIELNDGLLRERDEWKEIAEQAQRELREAVEEFINSPDDPCIDCPHAPLVCPTDPDHIETDPEVRALAEARARLASLESLVVEQREALARNGKADIEEMERLRAELEVASDEVVRLGGELGYWKDRWGVSSSEADEQYRKGNAFRDERDDAYAALRATSHGGCECGGHNGIHEGDCPHVVTIHRARAQGGVLTREEIKAGVNDHLCADCADDTCPDREPPSEDVPHPCPRFHDGEPRPEGRLRATPTKPRPKITRNAATCKFCLDTVESTSVHDYRVCSCGKVAVDGGLEYLKRSGDPAWYTDRSEYEGEGKPADCDKPKLDADGACEKHGGDPEERWPGLTEWLATGARGVASDTIVEVLTGLKCRRGRGKSHPHDVEDFRRCVLLIRAVPSLRDRLDAVGPLAKSTPWNRLTENWTELEELMTQADSPLLVGLSKAASAGRKLDARIWELLQ